MIALPVVVKLVRSVSVTVEDCETRSDIVRATSVTLRLTATPEANSTIPKNSVSISGTTKENSTAALAWRSRTKRPISRRTRYESLLMAAIPPCVLGFDMEGGSGREQPLAAAGVATDVGDVVAEAGDKERPLVER